MPIKYEGKVVSKAVCEGKKELLGMYVSESEGANFWLSVLTDLHNRGVKDMIVCINLKGFEEAIISKSRSAKLYRTPNSQNMLPV
jgi:putative transposase